MKYSDFVKRLVMLVLLVAPLALMGTPSFAQTVANLAAVEGEWTPPGSATPIAMWGFVDDPGSCPGAPVTWNSGPTIEVPSDGTDLMINLRNCLDEDVSIFIPGQLKPLAPVHEDTDGSGRMRVTSFDTITAPTAVGSYQWTGVKEGTYLYHSGTHPQVQVQMGLYGALVVDGGSYPAVTQDEVLLFSEIDPALHGAVDGGTYGTPDYPSTFDYKPKYFLINGVSYPDTAVITLTMGEDVLLRFVNAGLKTHVPALQGLYMSVVAGDGNLYPYPREQYSIELTAAKTMDALVNIKTDGSYALYDRSLHLTNAAATGGGMLTYLQVDAATGTPDVLDDAYDTVEDTDLIVLLVDGVLTNDPGPGANEASIVTGTSAGLLTFNADGSFDYTPNADFNGIDIFTYVANDGGTGPDSKLATVRITVTPVNDPPMAMDDPASTGLGTPVDIDAVANDTDVDGNLDPASANTISGPADGVLVNNSDGTFTYTPNALFSGVDSFVYEVCDTDLLCDTATVTITVSTTPPVNMPPVAVDDFADTAKNTDVTFSVIDNDVDPDGAIDVGTVVLTSLITTRGGSVTVDAFGEVTFTPKRGFRGTDTFTYTVDDDEGATSNEATARVNVLK